jgi:hypothetical protein
LWGRNPEFFDSNNLSLLAPANSAILAKLAARCLAFTYVRHDFLDGGTFYLWLGTTVNALKTYAQTWLSNSRAGLWAT